MNKLVKLVFAATAVVAFSASAQTTGSIPAKKPYSAYAQDGSSSVVRTGTGLCLRTGYWTPADATVVGCDGVIAQAAPAWPTNKS